MQDVVSQSVSDLSNIDLHDPESIKGHLTQTLITVVGRDPIYAQPQDWYSALTYLLRGVLSHRLAATARAVHQLGAKRVYYLSVEYLPGRTMRKVLVDLQMGPVVEEALQRLGISLDSLTPFDIDPALGNGGLGRLAACFLDSLATHRYPGFGYGIRYEFGMFSQSIERSQQVEHPEPWLRYGDPWQFKRPSIVYPIKFYGRLQRFTNGKGESACHWLDTDGVMALAYDLPVSGYRSNAALHLRLWESRASREFDLRFFNAGDYIAAMREKTFSENLSKVLYPSDNTTMGQELRLKQEYFFTSASLQDIIRRHLKSNPNLDNLAEKTAIQLNDTHPSLAIPELMRLLIDEHNHTWAEAWAKTEAIFGYTNHTLLPEALETWPISMLERMLPRHLDLIYRINEQHLEQVKRTYPGETERLGWLSLVDDYGRRIRMAHLAVVGSRKVNGVSELQGRLMRETVFSGFARMTPEKFTHVTNGITPRQWLVTANPRLAELITQRIGADWPTDLDQLSALAPAADDPAFREEFRAIKRQNKERLAKLVRETTGEIIDPTSMFDVQVKRIHEYKRQLLNLMHVISRYRRIKAGAKDLQPRTVIIGGKAAPGYDMAKRIIRLIGDVARVINNDPEARDLLKLVFIPNYKVSLAEVIIPGADLAEHISTAGTEASGTGNMKFAVNGALTLGTYDGANIEICNAVGQENMFLFGLRAAEITDIRARGYNPWNYYNDDEDLRACLDMIAGNAFSPEEPHRFAPVRDALLGGGDHYLLLADYRAYITIQDEIDKAYRNADDWSRRAVINVAHMGRFSADRAIHEYAANIWQIKPLPI